MKLAPLTISRFWLFANEMNFVMVVSNSSANEIWKFIRRQIRYVLRGSITFFESFLLQLNKNFADICGVVVHMRRIQLVLS